MNTIRLKGFIQNIQPSHTIGDTQYDKANVITKRRDGKEDSVDIRFKRYSNPFKDGDEVDIAGNLRTYSHVENGKTKVDIYVFTYFDTPEEGAFDDSLSNEVLIDGRICKIDDEVSVTKEGKEHIHLTLANNLYIGDNNAKLNSYIPCVCWGRDAKKVANLKVNDTVTIMGELHSREYKKATTNNECEIKVAHELSISGFSQCALSI